MSLDKVLHLAGAAPALPDPDTDLLLAAQAAAEELAVLLAGDGKVDDSKGDDDGDGGHADHPAYKALVKKKVPPARAASMCAQSDKKVKASRLARSLTVILSGCPGLDIGLITLADPAPGSGRIPDVRHLHAAAVLADAGTAGLPAGLVRLRARELGTDVASLPGFGLSDAAGEEEAELQLARAAKAVSDGGVAMNHAPFTGTHTHTHFQSAAHDHPHQHVNDSRHDGGPLHRPGSVPKREMW